MNEKNQWEEEQLLSVPLDNMEFGEPLDEAEVGYLAMHIDRVSGEEE